MQGSVQQVQYHEQDALDSLQKSNSRSSIDGFQNSLVAAVQYSATYIVQETPESQLNVNNSVRIQENFDPQHNMLHDNNIQVTDKT